MVMFEIILFSLVVLCGAVMLLCRWLLPESKRVVVEGAQLSSNAGIDTQSQVPWYLDYARSFFPVLLLIFILRGFIVEPYRIPSGSMLPTLEVGDFILVNKFSYGLRLPIVHDKVMDINAPNRGDIMVFRWPGDNKTNYIKRVIGVPGDRVEYRNKQLYLNGELIEGVAAGDYTPAPVGNQRKSRVLEMFSQIIPTAEASSQEVEYSILIDRRQPAKINKTLIVPPGFYFVLGDNRDHSADSRYWGFVPEENVVGKAFFIWFHYNTAPGAGLDFSRIGTTG